MIPPTLEKYLSKVAERSLRLDKAFCFDSDFSIQAKILSIFPEDKAFFAFYAGTGKVSPCPRSIIHPPQTSECFLVEIDAESLNVGDLVLAEPWIDRAQVILLRATLGFFWTGMGDLREIVRWWEDRQFRFVDILEYCRLHLFNAPLGPVVLAFEKRTKQGPSRNNGRLRNEVRANAGEGDRIRRCNEALAFMSLPIARAGDLTRFVGRGSFGFSGGLLNAGAVNYENRVILLARGEQVPWTIARKNGTALLNGCRPVLIELDDQLAIGSVREVTLRRGEGLEDARLEDFRLFRYQNELFSNHACVMVPGISAHSSEPLQTSSLRFAVGISRMDLANKELVFLGAPTLDRPLETNEKNWVFFEHQEQLYLLYSFKPYHLLRANRWSRLDFVTMFNRDFLFPLSEDGMPIRNSVNPVEYDTEYFIHVIHKVYPEKRYAFWAILIDKRTLMPKMITDRPLACGWHSAPASIIYICALVPRESEVLLFGGIDDSSMGVWRVPRSRLDSHWVALED